MAEQKPWNPDTDKVRLYSTQKFNDNHEKGLPRSPTLRRTSSVQQSSLSQSRSGTGVTEKTGSRSGKMELGSGRVGKGELEIREEHGNELSLSMEWGKRRADSVPTSLSSPRTVRSPAKEQGLDTNDSRHKRNARSRWPRPRSSGDQSQTRNKITMGGKDNRDHDSELRLSEFGNPWSSHDGHFPTRGLPIVSNEEDNRQRRRAKLQNSVDKDCPLSPKTKDPKSDFNPRSQSPGFGDILTDDSRIPGKASRSRISSAEQRSSLTLPKPQNTKDNVDDPGNHGHETVSDNNKEESDETGIPSKTPSYQNEHYSADPQPQPSGSEPSVIEAVAARLDRETSETDEAPNLSYSTGTLRNNSHDLRAKSPRTEHIKDHRLQSHPPSIYGKKVVGATQVSDDTPSSGTMESNNPDAQPQPSSNKCIVLTDPVKTEDNANQDHVEKQVDIEAWLRSGAPLAGNYRALSHGLSIRRSSSLDHPSSPGSGTDSLIVSPARTDEQRNSEEVDWNTFYRENAERMRIFDAYKTKSQLQPPSQEQRVKHEREKKAAERKQKSLQRRSSTLSNLSSLSSDGSLIVSAGQYDLETRTKSEPLQDDLEEAFVEYENRTALNLIALHKANYQLKKDMEAKETKFKREIQIAWKRPRPPPTTEEQRKDRVALEDIVSKPIFDEFGKQQRPIKTDPQLVLHETNVNIVIKRAESCHLLENYSQMYTHANRAVEAAFKLDFSPLTARCCYYRGLASYLYRDFGSARDDFVKARGCADLYGIAKETIERYIYLIDSAVDPETATLEKFPPRKASRGREIGLTSRSGRKETDSQEDSSPSTTDDAETLVEFPSRPPVDTALALSPNTSSDQEEHSDRRSPEDVGPQLQTLRRPSHIGRLPPDDDPQPRTEDIPTYQAQEETISEEIRKDIFESKAKSLSETGPPGPHAQEEETSVPGTIPSTEHTLFGSTTSPATTRRVRRPHIAPIATSFARGGASARKTSPQAVSDPEDAGRRDPEEMYSDDLDPDDMDADEIEEMYAAFGGRPGGRPQADATPDSASPEYFPS